MTERELFSAALEIADPRARDTFLAEQTQGDHALRQSVAGLLRAHDDAGSFLDHSPLDPHPTLATDGDTDAARSQGHLAATILTRPESADDLTFLTPSDRPGVLGTLDHYEVLSICGRGGMGIVLKAHDPRLKRIVALKVLSPEFAANPTARKRFLREAQAAAAVTHPHVVTIYAVEEGRPSSNDHRPSALPYLVMEYIAGQTLRDKIEREGTLPVDTILRIGSQIACGLAAAHKQGLIHRDIKPANVLLENGIERVKLTDFGLARAVDDVSVTRTGEVAGTPQYMSPEQAQGHAVDHRSDLFSLGSVLYTMCTGRPPFRGETVISVIRRVCDEAPRPIREVNPEIPAWLADEVNRLLQKNPAERFQTAAEVSDLLGDHLAHFRTSGKPAPQKPGVSQVTGFLGTRALLRNTARRRWLPAAALLGLCLLTLGATEATGVTNFAGTIIRIVRGDGTLVVSVDDPEVGVSIDGEDLVITGAGPKEIRVTPGQHKLTFSKDGQPVDQKLVKRSPLTKPERASVPDTQRSLGQRMQIGVGEIVRELHERYPEAQLGVTYNQNGLTVTGRPFSQYQADVIFNELQMKLVRRFPDLGELGPLSATIHPDKLKLINDLRIPPITEILSHLGPPVATGSQPAWSPDGKRIVYARNDGTALEIVDVATRSSTPYVEAADFPDRTFADPAWSPDGRDIAFSSRLAKGGHETEEIWVETESDLTIQLMSGGYPTWVAGQRDAEPELYCTSRGTPPIRLMAWTRSSPKEPARSLIPLPSLYAPVSPDGRLVACDELGKLQVRNVETGAVEQTWPLPVAAGGMILNWSPDSRWISVAPYGRDYLGLWIYDTAGQEGKRIVQGPVKGAVWSPDGTRMAIDTAGQTSQIWVVDLPPNINPDKGLTFALSGMAPPVSEVIDLQEFELDAVRVVRATKGELSNDERQIMLADQHPVFGQLADPQTKPIFELFASLTPAEHAQGRQAGYLKWKYADLPPARQQVYHDSLASTLEQTPVDTTPVKDMLSLEALERAEVGFANIDIPEKDARVCSWFILLPEYPSPIWVTIVNAKYRGTPEYYAAHNAQLSALRVKPLTPLAEPQSKTEGPGANVPKSTAQGDVFSQGALEEIVAKLVQLYPEAKLKLTHQNKELTVEGRPKDSADAQRILQLITGELITRFPRLKATRSDGTVFVRSSELRVMDKLQSPRALFNMLDRHGQRITTGKQPAWAPDGKSLAFTTFNGDVSRIEVGSRFSDPLASTSGRQFAGSTLVDPMWSTDGATIAFVSRLEVREDPHPQLWTLNVSSNEPRLLCDGESPSWGTKNGRLYFVATTEGGYVLNSVPGDDLHRSSVETCLELPSRCAAVSSDEALVATAANNTVQVFDLETKQLKHSWSLPTDSPGMRFSWSPDSRYLAVTPVEGPHRGLWIFDIRSNVDQNGLVIEEGVQQVAWAPAGDRLCLEVYESFFKPGVMWILPVATEDVVASLRGLLSEGEETPVSESPEPQQSRGASFDDAERLVELAQQDLDRVQQLHKSGAASAGEVRQATLELLDAQIAVACAKKERDEVAKLFDATLVELEGEVEAQRTLLKRGVATDAEVRNAMKNVFRQRQLKQAALDALEP
jgi:Tol biopolymer transport system component